MPNSVATVHKYWSSDTWNIYSYCSRKAWKNGSRYWKKVTCPKCLALKGQLRKLKETPGALRG